MLLCKYFNPKLDYETQEKVEDDDYYEFASRNPEETQASHCIKVVASGAWLDRIRRHFSNLPLMETGVYPPTIAWYGDHAKFIAGNIADVCSAYFQSWSKASDRSDEEPKSPERIALDKIQALNKNFKLTELELTLKIQEVLDGCK